MISINKCLDRFPSRPVLKEGYPKNITALENSTVTFDCPIISDLEPHIMWAKFRASNGSSKIPNNVHKFPVKFSKLSMFIRW